MWEYTDKVKEHFLNPRNAGEVENPDGVAEVGSMACGDALKLTFKVGDDGKISEAKFQTFGCASAIASASALTEMLKGKSVEEAENLTNQDIADYLGGLPKEKMHCSVLGRQALEQAIAHYRGQPKKEQEGEIVCECFGVTDVEIEKAVRENNLSTVEDVTNYTKAGGGCESCHDKIREIISRVQSEAKAPAKPRLSNIQKIKMIEEVMERDPAFPAARRRRYRSHRRRGQPCAGRHPWVLCRVQGFSADPEKFCGDQAEGTGLARACSGGGGPVKTIYMDNNATTRVAPEVLEAMLPYLGDLYGNPSSAYSFGGQVAGKIREARERVAALIGAAPEEIIFTSCGSESDNTAVLSALATEKAKRHVVTSRVEHPAVKSLGAHLVKQGCQVTEIPVNGEGLLDMDRYKKSLTPDTAIVSLMWANNETGVLFPVQEAAAMAKERGILFHTDAVQAVGKIPIDMKRNAIDMLSLSGHKLHAAKGVGVLYVRKGTRFSPFLIGGHQENGRRGGTENTASIAGLGKACELAALRMEEENTRVKALRDRL